MGNGLNVKIVLRYSEGRVTLEGGIHLGEGTGIWGKGAGHSDCGGFTWGRTLGFGEKGAGHSVCGEIHLEKDTWTWARAAGDGWPMLAQSRVIQGEVTSLSPSQGEEVSSLSWASLWGCGAQPSPDPLPLWPFPAGY